MIVDSAIVAPLQPLTISADLAKKAAQPWHEWVPS